VDLLVRLVALTGSLGFFVLKIVDVPWLRLRPGKHSWIAATIIIALMHVGAVQRVTTEASFAPSITVVSALAAIGLADPSAARRSFFTLLSFARPTAKNARPSFSATWLGWLETGLTAFHRILISALAPRAPPCAAH